MDESQRPHDANWCFPKGFRSQALYVFFIHFRKLCEKLHLNSSSEAECHFFSFFHLKKNTFLASF